MLAENFLEWGERTGLARWIVVNYTTGATLSRLWTVFGWANFFRVQTCWSTAIFAVSTSAEFRN